jgi:hypothetical protein
MLATWLGVNTSFPFSACMPYFIKINELPQVRASKANTKTWRGCKDFKLFFTKLTIHDSAKSELLFYFYNINPLNHD